MSTGFIDMHHHLLFGMDDGATTYREALQMMRAARICGIDSIIATPHAYPGISKFDMDKYHERLRQLQEVSITHRDMPRIYGGAEIYSTESVIRFLSSNRVPTMNNTNFVLIEWNPKVEFKEISVAIRALANEGYITIMAHVERYMCLWRKIKELEELKNQFNIRIQVNCDTIIGNSSMMEKYICRNLLKNHIADYIATDAHNTTTRKAHMDDAFVVLEQRYGIDYAKRITGLNQTELLISRLK